MTLQYVYGATVVVFAFGVVTVGPAYAQRRDGSLLPQEQSGQVTAVGCLVRGDAVRGGKKDKYALARPRKGPVASVPEASCTADPGADALTLDNPEKGQHHAMRCSAAGWRSAADSRGKPSKDPDNLRELDVASFKLVPVVIPPRTAAAPPPPPAGASTATDPTGTGADACTGSGCTQRQSLVSCRRRRATLPAIGLAGLLSLAAGLMLRSFRLRQRG